MNGEKLVQYTALMLQDQVLMDLVFDGDVDDSQCCTKITIAIRDALAEVSKRYPVYLTKTVTSSTGSITNAQIAADGSYKVCSVTKDGKQVPFSVDHLGVNVGSAGTYTVTYTPEIFDVDLYASFTVAPEVGFVMMMHLVARNYCMLSGRMEEAAMYDERYNDYAEMTSLKRKARLPARRFI